MFVQKAFKYTLGDTQERLKVRITEELIDRDSLISRAQRGKPATGTIRSSGF
jgi:hypothetical protein